MEVRDKLSVQEWHQDVPPPRDTPPVAMAAWKSPALLGVLGTSLLHVILFASLGVFLGGARIPIKPDQNRMGAVGSSESLILLSISAVPRSRDLNVDVRPPSKVLDDAPLLLKPPPNVNVERLALADEPVTGGDAELTQAAEIYDRQIRARIELIWQLLRTKHFASSKVVGALLGEATFKCQAQLEQDDRGNVIEVLLPVCNGPPEWRESLLTAIRQASPLPAPPDPRVFSSSLILHFVVQESATRPPGDYE